MHTQPPDSDNNRWKYWLLLLAALVALLLVLAPLLRDLLGL